VLYPCGQGLIPIRVGYSAHGFRSPPHRDPRRRCGGILAPDGADEEGTHERLRAHLQELVDPKIAEHHGRIVKTTGDGFLAEFASVVDAVRCGVELQGGMVERNTATPATNGSSSALGSTSAMSLSRARTSSAMA
jgi:hypothetical protein